MTLSSPVSSLPRVGPALEKRLKKLGISTIQDLLFTFPRAYEDYSVVANIGDIKEGMTVCVKGTVKDASSERSPRKYVSVTEILLEDATGTCKAIWFRQPYLATAFQKGDVLYVAGKVVRDKYGVYLSNPSHEKESSHAPIHTARIIPIYPETAGVSSRWLRSLIHPLLTNPSQLSFKETLPKDILEQRGFLPLFNALLQIHFPVSLRDTESARERFAFEELFVILLFIFMERKKLAQIKAHKIPLNKDLMKRFTDALSFTLTDAQRKAAWKILKDMEKPRPMNRLLEGDVGSGKTVVATMAALSTAREGFQTVFMAPTEILAQQHFKTVSSLLAPLKIVVGLLTGSTDLYTSPKLPKEPIEISRKKLLEKTKDGDIQVLVGTHSLIQDKVKFGKLALVVLDEQHRFGVKQRAKLLHKDNLIPHLLSMTATPIPRTMAMTMYGDLDLTIIDQLPKGRKPVITTIIVEKNKTKAYDLISKEVEGGRQAFVICPRIEDKEEGANITSVEKEYREISAHFPKLTVAMLHGKISSREKEVLMRKMKMGKIHILVATSVVEVGVDIPNASVMVIEGAERFGLAQLHQFRGRVGRSEYQSYCVLIPSPGVSGAQSRLKALTESATGFELAERDFALRGPGQFTGTKQWGVPDFAMGYLTNATLVATVRETASALLEKDLTLSSYPELKKRVEELREKLHLE